MDEPPLSFDVLATESDLRLDAFLRARLPGVAMGAIRRVIEHGKVIVDGRPGKKGQRLREGQRVLAATAPDERPRAEPEMPLTVIDVTPAVVALDKPPGVPTHPLLPGETGTLANALVARFPECAEAGEAAREGGLVHRLDTGTSGVIIAARSRRAFEQLRALFRAGRVEKRYVALVAGVVEDELVIDAAIDPDPRDRRRVTLAHRDDAGLSARSVVEPSRQLGDLTLVEVSCSTGRRHQVRVHLASRGHPLVGDALYGGPTHPSLAGALLHAAEVRFEGRAFAAPLPAAWRELIDALDAERGLRWPG